MHEAEVVSDAVIQPRMVHHVDSLAFVELSFHIKHGLVHGLSFADLVHEPAVFLILSVLQKSTDVFATYINSKINFKTIKIILTFDASLHGFCEDTLYLDLNSCRAIKFTTGFGELFHGHILTSLKIYAEPDNGYASFAQETQLFEA